MTGFYAALKLPSAHLGGPVSGLFEARTKDPSHPTFSLTLGQWKFLFKYWNEGLTEIPPLSSVPEELPVAPTSPVEALPVKTSDLIESKVVIPELQGDNGPPPIRKSSNLRIGRRFYHEL